MAEKEQANPAIANNSYCSNGGIWNIDGQNISFNNSSSYSKEIPKNKKIIWDLGEYIPVNQNNFTYQITESEEIFASSTCDALGVPFDNECPIYNCNVSISGYSGVVPIGEKWQIISQQGNPIFGPGSVFSTIRNHLTCVVIGLVTVNNTSSFEFYYSRKWRTVKNLEINDGGNLNIFRINDENSVQVVDISGNAKFKFNFNINGVNQEIIADKNSIVSVSCNCPPDTLDCGDCCLECQEIFNEISGLRKLINSLRGKNV